MFTINAIVADDVLQTSGLTQQQLDQVVAGIQQAADLWARYIDGNNAIIDLALDFRDLSGSTLAQAGSSFFSQGDGPFESEVISELNGEPGFFSQDGTFTVDLPNLLNDRFFFADSLEFDETPGAPGQIDFLTLAAHELGHVLGFLGLSFDGFVNGSSQFIGANAVTANGGNPVELAGDEVHIAGGDLLSPSISSNLREPINEVHIGILQDLSVPIVKETNAADILYGFNQSNDSLNGEGGDDILNGLSGDDTLNGSSGADIIFASAGFDTIDGGADVDLFDLSNSTGVNTNWINLEASGSQFRVDEGAGFVGRAKLTGIENVRDSFGSDRFFGNSEDNSYFYSSGFDTVDGNGGIDTLDISGLTRGFQWIDLEASSSQLRSNDGNGFVANAVISDVENFVTTIETDHFRGDLNDQTVVYTGGRDFIDGRAGSDTLDFSDYDNGNWINLNIAFDQFRFIEADEFVSGGNLQNIENGIGGDGNDFFFGDDMDNLFFGGLGNDRFEGGLGVDTFAVEGEISDYSLSHSGATYALNSSSGTDRLLDVEQVQIGDEVYNINDLDALI